MYGNSHTTPRLKLVSARTPGSEEGLLLAPSERLQRFALAAGSAGLVLEEAVRLAVERSLALSDCHALGIDRETARRKLCHVASGARATRQLSESQAKRIRSLNLRRPRPTAEVSHGCTVLLPDKLMTRSLGAINHGAIDAGAIDEMISWEIAATLSGRTMCEWAMLAVGSRGAAA